MWSFLIPQSNVLLLSNGNQGPANMDSAAAKWCHPDVIPKALLSHMWLFYDNYREYLHNLNKYAANMCFTYLGKT